MEKIMTVEVPIVHSVIGRVTVGDGRDFRPYQYFCNICRTYFEVIRKRRSTGIYYYTFDDDRVICPICGIHHSGDNVGYGNVPFSAKIDLLNLKEAVVLKCKYQKVIWSEHKGIIGTDLEELRFNIKERRAYFKKNGKTQVLGNPLNMAFFNKSLCNGLIFRSGARHQIKELCKLVTETRTLIEKKFLAIHGFKLKGTYIHYDVPHGFLAFPLFNIGFRLTFVDSKNLTCPTEWFYNFEEEREVWENIPGKKPYTYLLKYYDLPDIPTVRKIIADKLWHIQELSLIKKLTPDINYWKKLLDQVHMCNGSWYELLEQLIPIYGIKAVIRFIDGSDWYHVRDIVRMLNSLSPELKKKATKLKIRQVHDWCDYELKKLRYENVSLQIKKSIVDKLGISTAALSFNIPTMRHELLYAGMKLHNCVNTYAEDCIAGKCVIVLVKDKDKLVACLELRNNELVQAKLKLNKKLKDNEEINSGVLDWCRKTGIRINTDDVKKVA